MFGFFSSLTKLIIASLITGAVLTKLDLSAAVILEELGMTPDDLYNAINRGYEWALPNIILGSLVIVPVWLVIFLFRPPRGEYRRD